MIDTLEIRDNNKYIFLNQNSIIAKSELAAQLPNIRQPVLSFAFIILRQFFAKAETILEMRNSEIRVPCLWLRY